MPDRDLPKILVVEDEDAIALALNLLLTQEGYTCERVSDGREALTRAELFCPDLVLLDASLAGVSGYDICQTLRGAEALRDTPILMMTQGGNAMEERRARALGANAIIAKPFELEALAARISGLLGCPPDGARDRARDGAPNG